MEQDTSAWVDEWQRLLWQVVAERIPSGDGNPTATAEQLRDAIETWRQTLQALVPPDASLAALAQQLTAAQHAAIPWLAALGSNEQPVWPTLGPMQNEQQRGRALAQAFSDYRDASLYLADTLIALLDDCLAAYAEARHDADAAVDLQARVALWVEIAEARYQTYLQEGPLAERLAAVANAWAECRLRGRELLDPMVEGLGMPSRTQLDDTQTHLARLQRRVTSEVERLRAEIDGVRRELGEAPRRR